MSTIFFLLLIAASVQAHDVRLNEPDLPPDASSSQLLHALKEFSRPSLRAPDDAIAIVRQAGARNMKWLEYMNSFRAPEDKISLSSKETARGYPIDKPTEYSPRLIADRLAKLKEDLPVEMREVIFNSAPFTKDPPIALLEFIHWGNETDHLYQSALRWQLMEGRLDEMAARRARDVRGVYFFSLMDSTERSQKLSNPGRWTSAERAQFKDWLTSMCMNNGAGESDCRSQIEQAVSRGEGVLSLYQSWRSRAQSLYNSFFVIPAYARRSDVLFQNANLTSVAFQNPSSRAVINYLRDNIEDEWRFGSWSLKLAFSSTADIRIRFVPGATPHVNGLGGNTITMNSEQPLTEYDSQWAIRHEFGHVLGLPDCYVEYYDSVRQLMVSYQIDTENLMCSRRGHILERHVRELRRVYSGFVEQL